MKITEKIGARIALINGMSFGLGFLILITILGAMFADGLLGLIGIGALLTYNYLFISLILLYLTFPLALWIFGRKNSININQGKSVLKTSAEFSFGVNLIIWSVFLISQIAFGGFEHIIELNLIIFCIILILGTFTTLSLGIYIVKLTKEKIKPIQN